MTHPVSRPRVPHAEVLAGATQEKVVIGVLHDEQLTYDNPPTSKNSDGFSL